MRTTDPVKGSPCAIRLPEYRVRSFPHAECTYPRCLTPNIMFIICAPTNATANSCVRAWILRILAIIECARDVFATCALVGRFVGRLCERLRLSQAIMMCELSGICLQSQPANTSRIVANIKQTRIKMRVCTHAHIASISA